MRYGSVCSGIEAASVAWKALGWEASFLSEIEPFPRAVLSHHYPEVPLHGDFTTIEAGQYAPIDLLVGGTPCQSFSVAGLRGGLDDDRGNLALEYLRLADRLRPRWLVWENVPGVLSSAGGRDFGSILGGLVELGYGFAYRVLDAQFFGVAQRRRRVFVVGYAGDWRRAAAVLFERHSLSGHPSPRREAGQGFTHELAPSLTSSSRGVARAGETRGQDPVVAVQAFGGNDTRGPIDVATACNAHGGPMGRLDFESETFIAHTLKGEGFDASEDGTGRGTPIVPVAFPWQLGGTMQMSHDMDLCGSLVKSQTHAVAFTCSEQANSFAWERPYAPTISAQVPNDSSNLQVGVRISSAVRRLTPRECERLQGFPDDYTLIPWRKAMASDGPRYKALGNSMAVPVMSWIGRRIAAVDALSDVEAAA